MFEGRISKQNSVIHLDSEYTNYVVYHSILLTRPWHSPSPETKPISKRKITTLIIIVAHFRHCISIPNPYTELNIHLFQRGAINCPCSTIQVVSFDFSTTIKYIFVRDCCNILVYIERKLYKKFPDIIQWTSAVFAQIREPSTFGLLDYKSYQSFSFCRFFSIEKVISFLFSRFVSSRLHLTFTNKKTIQILLANL